MMTCFQYGSSDEDYCDKTQISDSSSCELYVSHPKHGQQRCHSPVQKTLQIWKIVW